MAPCEITDNYYEILGITQTADKITIQSSYRRLAKLRHPDKCPNDASATARFQLLLAAYTTLIDAEKRQAYDRIYPSIRLGRQTTAGGDPAAAGASGGTAPRAGTTGQHAAGPETKRRMEELSKTLDGLLSQRRSLDIEIFEARRVLNQTKAALTKLGQEEARDAQEYAAAHQTWFSFLVGRREPPEEKEARERRATERSMGRIVREAELSQRQGHVDKVAARLQDVDTRIAKARRDMALEQEWEKARQEAAERAERMRQQEQREAAERAKQRHQQEQWKAKLAEWRRQQEQQEAEAVEKIREQEQQEALQRAERKRKQEQQEALQRAERKRKQEQQEALQRAERKRKQEQEQQRAIACQHRGWWNRVEGSRLCGLCRHSTTRYAFQCPGCPMIACAGCRVTLKGGSAKRGPR